MSKIPSFREADLEAICSVLGDTSEGLTGSEIGQLLKQCSVPDPLPDVTKRHRLREALSQAQHRDGCGNIVVVFIRSAMDPVRYTRSPDRFDNLRSKLNEVLAFSGYTLSESGDLYAGEPARTLDQARQRANRLRKALEQRKVHPDVLRFCRPEYLDEDHFHAVLEATKSVADKIRAIAGLTSDGSPLVDEAFGFKEGQYPLLAINEFKTPSEHSEHRGFMSLLKGTFQTFRNPTAHEPRIFWPVREEDALDLLSMVSFLHRRLDEAALTPTGIEHSE